MLVARADAYRLLTSVIVAPLTTAIRDIPSVVVLTPREDGVPRHSVVNLDNMMLVRVEWLASFGPPPLCSTALARPPEGSIIMLLATDAPLDARQLARLARRAPLGMARTGATADHSSGDFVLAWSTAYRIPNAAPEPPLLSLTVLHDAALGPLFQAAVEATEEAILNALCCAEPVGDMPALPVADVLALLS